MTPLFFFNLLLLTAAVAFPVIATGISNPSLDAVLQFLRSNGHALLANSIATSDLVSDVLPLQSLTLLAPPDTSLEMTQQPASNLSTLRLHLIPSSIDLNPSSHSSSRLLPTLLPSRALRASFSGEGDLLLDGVPVLFPRAYNSGSFSVYRLRRPLPSSPPSTTTSVDAAAASPPPASSGFRNNGKTSVGTVVTTCDAPGEALHAAVPKACSVSPHRSSFPGATNSFRLRIPRSRYHENQQMSRILAERNRQGSERYGILVILGIALLFLALIFLLVVLVLHEVVAGSR